MARSSLLRALVGRIALLVGLVAASACSSPTEPTVALGQAFTLARGESVAVDGRGAVVRFLRVSGDSRCPADALCVTGGDAIVHLLARQDGSEAELELHTGNDDLSAADHGTIRVALVRLEPYPFSGRTIEQDEYRATLLVSER